MNCYYKFKVEKHGRLFSFPIFFTRFSRIQSSAITDNGATTESAIYLNSYFELDLFQTLSDIGQSNSKCLKCRKGILKIKCVCIPIDAPELHDLKIYITN